MEEQDKRPKTEPAAIRRPPGPPNRTTVGFCPGGDDFEGKPVTIYTAVEGEGKFIRQPDEIPYHGHIIVRIEPNGKGKGIEIRNQTPKGAIQDKFIESASEGIRLALDQGTLNGPQITDVVVRIVGGSSDQNASNELAFKMAAIFSIQDAIKRAKLKAIG